MKRTRNYVLRRGRETSRKQQVAMDHLDCGHQRGSGRMQYAVGALEVQCDNMRKQGRIHGYPSRVWVDRGRIWGHLVTWAGAVRAKTAKTKKCTRRIDGPTDRQTNGRTDQRTDGRTKRGVESRSMRLKNSRHP